MSTSRTTSKCWRTGSSWAASVRKSTVALGLIAFWTWQPSFAQVEGCADLNVDGFVNFQDLALFREQFGRQSSELPACRLILRAMTFTVPDMPGIDSVVVYCHGGVAFAHFQNVIPNTSVGMVRVMSRLELCDTECYHAIAYSADNTMLAYATGGCYSEGWDGIFRFPGQ